MTHTAKTLTTLTGMYCLAGNPCTTKPCLPGIAPALFAEEKYYSLTLNDSWLPENRSWHGYIPQPNDPITVTGSLQKREDIFGYPYQTIEVATLRHDR